MIHNLLFQFPSDALNIVPLTGRKCGGGRTCALRDWNVEANVLLASKKAPWLHMHTQKHGSHGELLVTNDTMSHNLVIGHAPVFGNQGGWSRKAQPEGVEIEDNVGVAGGFDISFDEASLTLSIQSDARIAQTGCAPGGPGGDVDFTGARRSMSQCVPGPLEGLIAGQLRNISLLPSAIPLQSATDSVLLV